MFHSWDELRDLSVHGSLDTCFFRNCETNPHSVDQEITKMAAVHLSAEQPDLSFVYLCESDLTGHDHGWMSPPYIASIERMDRALATLIETLQQAHVYEQFIGSSAGFVLLTK